MTLEQTDAWVPGSCSSEECQQLLLAGFLIHKQIPAGLAVVILRFLLLPLEVVVVVVVSCVGKFISLLNLISFLLTRLGHILETLPPSQHLTIYPKLSD